MSDRSLCFKGAIRFILLPPFTFPYSVHFNRVFAGASSIVLRINNDASCVLLIAKQCWCYLVIYSIGLLLIPWRYMSLDQRAAWQPVTAGWLILRAFFAESVSGAGRSCSCRQLVTARYCGWRKYDTRCSCAIAAELPSRDTIVVIANRGKVMLLALEALDILAKAVV
jgi:hypothetical protein